MNSQQIINLIIGIFFIIIIIIIIVSIIYRSKIVTVANKLPGGFFANLKNIYHVKKNQPKTVNVVAAYQENRLSHDYANNYNGGHNKPKRKNSKRRRH